MAYGVKMLGYFKLLKQQMEQLGMAKQVRI